LVLLLWRWEVLRGEGKVVVQIRGCELLLLLIALALLASLLLPLQKEPAIRGERVGQRRGRSMRRNLCPRSNTKQRLFVVGVLRTIQKFSSPSEAWLFLLLLLLFSGTWKITATSPNKVISAVRGTNHFLLQDGGGGFLRGEERCPATGLLLRLLGIHGG
jgi:hypothetical protein